MTSQIKAFFARSIFDGESLHQNSVLIVEQGKVSAIKSVEQCDLNPEFIDDTVELIAPAYVDLQVNGGGGVMFNDSPNVETLEQISLAHAKLGTLSLLPTLISDTPEKTRAAIDAVEEAIQMGIPGILGLHLEGPHLDPDKKGAHDGSVLRPMTQTDLALLLSAKERFPVLKLTFAPGQVTDDQIDKLIGAGVVLSLGHTNALGDQCCETLGRGVTCVTHLFNAMSQMTARDCGLVGAALNDASVNAGLIADGLHVAPALIELAFRAKKGPGKLFLVSDSMATAGSQQNQFYLNGRLISKSGASLRLEDGTLAGAHLALSDAVQTVSSITGISLHEAHALASSVPSDIVGMENSVGYLSEHARADFVCLNVVGGLERAYQGGEQIR